jgi:asparaginyl-tRNA synthetase
MIRSKIKQVLTSEFPRDQINIKGWIKTRRDSKEFSFLEVNDGSCLNNLQIIATAALDNYNEIKRLGVGSAVSVTGPLLSSEGKGQLWEVQARQIEILSTVPENYPLQKKRHTDDFLREIAHLRPRTRKYSAAFRIRSDLSWAIHNFFRKRGFHYIHTPIITSSDCEGAGEMFRVTTLDAFNIPIKEDKIDYSQDFFGSSASLTVSGQLTVEMFALALGDVYTFGPTFRAENSNTRRHAAEFWMIEPEMAFCNLSEDMLLAEELIKELSQFAMTECREDMELFYKYVDTSLFQTLSNIAESDFIKLPYAEAIQILEKAPISFSFPPKYGLDLQTEHERYLTESFFNKPVIVYNYPQNIKPFYMRLNDDNETVAAMDVLVPKIGEIIGGSQREERLPILEARMDAMALNKENYSWYLDSRRFGSVEHSGFGLGFERLIMLITGINNIRDVLPFPRTPNNINY